MKLPNIQPKIKASDYERAQLKRLCLQIAFTDVDKGDSQFRDSAIRNAQKIFREVEDADFYNW